MFITNTTPKNAKINILAQPLTFDTEILYQKLFHLSLLSKNKI